MKLFRILILGLACALNAQASPSKIVLLLAVPHDSGRGFLRPGVKDAQVELGQRFEKFFKNSGYETVVVQDAKVEAVYQALHDPQAAGVFVVSHAASERVIKPGLKGVDTVIDSEGRNINALFSEVHPGLKFLGIVGCAVGPMLKKYDLSGYYLNNKNIVLWGSDHRIDPLPLLGMRGESFDGLGRALDASKTALFTTPETKEWATGGDPNDTTSSRSPFFTIRRTIPNYVDAGIVQPVQVLMDGRLVAFLPRAEPGAIQSVDVRISPLTYYPNGKKLQLTVDSFAPLGLDATRIELGQFQLEPSWSGAAWDAVSDEHGVPMGITKNVFEFSGRLPN